MKIGERYKVEIKSSGRIKKGAVGIVVGYFNDDENFPRLNFGDDGILVVSAKNLTPSSLLSAEQIAAIKESLEKTGFVIDVEIPHADAQAKFAVDYRNVKGSSPDENNEHYHWYPSEAFTYSLRLKTTQGKKISHRVEGSEVNLMGAQLGEFIWELLSNGYNIGLNQPTETECRLQSIPS